MADTKTLLRILLVFLYVTLIGLFLSAIGIIVMAIVFAVIFKSSTYLLISLSAVFIVPFIFLTLYFIKLTKGSIEEFTNIYSRVYEVESGLKKLKDVVNPPKKQKVVKPVVVASASQPAPVVEEKPVGEQPVIKEEPKQEPIEPVIQEQPQPEPEQIYIPGTHLKPSDVDVNEEQVVIKGKKCTLNEISNLYTDDNRVCFDINDETYVIDCADYQEATKKYYVLYFAINR